VYRYFPSTGEPCCDVSKSKDLCRDVCLTAPPPRGKRRSSFVAVNSVSIGAELLRRSSKYAEPRDNYVAQEHLNALFMWSIARVLDKHFFILKSLSSRRSLGLRFWILDRFVHSRCVSCRLLSFDKKWERLVDSFLPTCSVKLPNVLWKRHRHGTRLLYSVTAWCFSCFQCLRKASICSEALIKRGTRNSSGFF
jgi:hypothetical protein